MITQATKEQRKAAMRACQYYRSVGHTPESAWKLARTFITGVIKA